MLTYISPFFKKTFSHICLALVFSLSLPDDSSTVNAAPPSSFAHMTHTRYHIRRITGFPRMAFFPFLLLCYLPVGHLRLFLGMLSQQYKLNFQELIRVYLLQVEWVQGYSWFWNQFSHFALVILWGCSLSAFPEILNICCLQSTSKLSSFLWASLSLARWLLLFHRCWQPLVTCLFFHSVSTTFVVNHPYSSYLVIQIPLVPW